MVVTDEVTLLGRIPGRRHGGRSDPRLSGTQLASQTCALGDVTEYARLDRCRRHDAAHHSPGYSGAHHILTRQIQTWHGRLRAQARGKEPPRTRFEPVDAAVVCTGEFDC